MIWFRMGISTLQLGLAIVVIVLSMRLLVGC